MSTFEMDPSKLRGGFDMFKSAPDYSPEPLLSVFKLRLLVKYRKDFFLKGLLTFLCLLPVLVRLVIVSEQVSLEEKHCSHSPNNCVVTEGNCWKNDGQDFSCQINRLSFPKNFF